MKPIIEDFKSFSCTTPLSSPESDGTLNWQDTTIVFVCVRSGSHWGLGYSYTHKAVKSLNNNPLSHVVRGEDPFLQKESGKK